MPCKYAREMPGEQSAMAAIQDEDE